MGARFSGLLAASILAWSGAADAGPVLHASRLKVDWGWAAAFFPHDAQAVFVSNIGDAPLTLTAIALGGLNPSDFTIGGTCQASVPIPPGDRCRIEAQLFFNPSRGRAWWHRATLAIGSDGAAAPTVISLEAIELRTDLPGRDPDFVPDWLDFPAQQVGTTSSPVSFVIANQGGLPLNVRAISLLGTNVADFALTSDCVGHPMLPSQACTAAITFAPKATGPRSAQLLLDFFTESYTYRSLTGVGVGGGPPAIAPAVEFHHLQLDHYFVTAIAGEIAALDTGAQQGWKRTGDEFHVWPTLAGAPGGASPVCRIYIPPSDGNSHFYSASPEECADTRARYPHFQYEADEVMAVRLPDRVTGECASDTIPVYRLWNQRVDVNHRYTTNLATRQTMIARGYAPEGYGPQGVALCAPL